MVDVSTSAGDTVAQLKAKIKEVLGGMPANKQQLTGPDLPVFKDKDVNTAVEKALDGGDVINVYTRSNFGFAFHEFWKNHLAVVDNRTTVLVLGDARNNYNDPKAWCLRDIHNKAKNVVWLNPESPSAWGFGDSVMDRYLPYCDVVEECRNLRQLAKIVDQIVL